MLLTDTSDLKTWCCPTSHLTSGMLQSFILTEYELVTVFTPQESERQNRFLPSRFHIHLLSFFFYVESKQPRTRAGPLKSQWSETSGLSSLQILWFYLPDLHQRKWMRCLFILIYIFSDLRFFRVNFLSLFVAVSFPPSPSLPLPLPPSLPPSQSWQSILSLLLYHSHFGRLPKGRGKEKKKNVLSPDRKLILVICIKNIKRHRHEKRIWGDTLIKHSG